MVILMPKILLQIISENKLLEPLIEDDVVLQLEKKGAAGKLSFKVVIEENISFEEGDAVSLMIDDVPIFYGTIFEKQTSKDKTITATAYDQIKYMILNKYSFVFEDKRADEILKEVASDYGLKVNPEVISTVFPIPTRTYENKSLYDIVQEALDITFDETGIEYVLYDDFGKLTLGYADTMKTDLMIAEDTAEDFTYISSIDRETYNSVVLIKKSSSETAEAVDNSNIEKWGVLRYFESITDGTETLQTRAQMLLNAYNRRTKKLSLSGVYGKLEVRAGSLVSVSLDLVEYMLNDALRVYSVTHTFSNHRHKMDLVLEGGDFVA